MPSRPGYFDRLVLDATGRTRRAARAPRQIAWGPPRPASPDATDVGVEAPGPAPTAVPPPAARPVAQRPGRTSEPAPRAPLRVVPDPRPHSADEPAPRPPARAAAADDRTPAHTRPARPDSGAPAPRPAPPLTVASVPPGEPPRRPERSGPPAPFVTSPPAPSAPIDVTPAVTAAFERLAGLSMPLARPSPPAPPPTRTEPSSRVPAERATAERARVAAPVISTVAAAREDTLARGSQVHIGSIEVRIDAPPTPTPPVAAPVAPAPVAAAVAAPTTRLSRPSTGYGLGQG